MGKIYQEEGWPFAPGCSKISHNIFLYKIEYNFRTAQLLMKDKVHEISLLLKQKRVEVQDRKRSCDQKWVALKSKEAEVIIIGYPKLWLMSS